MNKMSNVMATMKVKEWDDDQLLDWIQEKRPKLLRVGENLEKFKAAQISGEVFLMLAADMEFFEKKKKSHLPVRPSRGLAELAREIAGDRRLLPIYFSLIVLVQIQDGN
jgi:hypothetical protein